LPANFFGKIFFLPKLPHKGAEIAGNKSIGYQPLLALHLRMQKFFEWPALSVRWPSAFQSLSGIFEKALCRLHIQ
jgi:hypothetical protein